MSDHSEEQRPASVPPEVWREYADLMGRAHRGAVEGRHLARIHEIRGDHPDLAAMERRRLRWPA